MEPQQPTPPAPQGATPKTPETSGAAHIDIGSILLPKKETPGQTPASAQRVNASVLLEQEQNATLLSEKPEKKEPPARLVPTPASLPKEATTVQPLETYQRDIEGLVKDKNVSILSIAAAEAERRGKEQTTPGAAATNSSGGSWVKTITLYGVGLLLLAGASGALAYIVERPTSVSAPQAVAAPFIAVDETKDITIDSGTTRTSLMATLTAAKQATSLSLGLISRLLITTASSTGSGQSLAPIDAQSFFTLIAPDMPDSLLRTINPTYLLGVHVYNDNQPFLILSVDSYEQAYAGMLAWEPTMQQDLSPLFDYTPTVHIPEENVATTTNDASQQLTVTGFADSIVENHDARVIENSTGDISLLWTFLDSNTLVITTNDATLREIISRLQEAPITPIPSQ